MKYLSLQAQSFGSLHDREMVFSPGLNIIFGPNEAGKSTWHAALYLSLCGVKRGRGTTKEQREFLERYRPWGGDEYKLRLLIELEDGRQIEIDQDLRGKVDCKATELTLGKDVTGEIIHEGSPDGALWLNLNRQTFLATACVKQGELLEVLLHADSLQEKLQKSADGIGGDFTVKNALDLLDRFQKEQIGKSNSKGERPLSVATREFKAAQKQKVELEQAYSAHQELLDEVECLRVKEFDGQSQLRKLKGALNWKSAECHREEFEQASSLQSQLNDLGFDPARNEDKKKLIRSVSSCLEIWENCPSEPDLSGPSASEIRWEIENLAPTPSIEPQSDPDIIDTHRAFTQSCEALDSHSGVHPKQNSIQKVVKVIAFFSAILLAGAVSVPKSWEGVDLSLALVGGVGALF